MAKSMPSKTELHCIITWSMESTTGYCPPVWDLLLALA
jgi:hypothetical protein